MAAPGAGCRRLKEPTACPANGCHCMLHVQPIDSGFSAELVSTPMAATNPALCPAPCCARAQGARGEAGFFFAQKEKLFHKTVCLAGIYTYRSWARG